MRDNVRAFVQIAAESFELAGPVYEFGAYQVEGQEEIADLRPCFPGSRYVGCDMRAGPGVDRIEDLAGLSLPDDTAQTIVCVETLEHVFEARRAMDEMIRVLAPGGVLLISSPFDFRLHDYPSDYWRLTPSCLARLLAPCDATLVGWQGPESFPHTVLAIGCKAPAGARFGRAANRFIDGYQAWLRQAAAEVPWSIRLKNTLRGCVRGKGERRRVSEQHEAGFALSLPDRQNQAAAGHSGGIVRPLRIAG